MKMKINIQRKFYKIFLWVAFAFVLAVPFFVSANEASVHLDDIVVQCGVPQDLHLSGNVIFGDPVNQILTLDPDGIGTVEFLNYNNYENGNSWTFDNISGEWTNGIVHDGIRIWTTGEHTITAKLVGINNGPTFAEDTKYFTIEACLSSISITHPANKLIYTVGDPLDITSMVITGTYSDGSTQIETITSSNVSGFDSSAPVVGQVLTITFGGKTTTYAVDIVAPLSSAKEITTLSFSGLNPVVNGVVNEMDHTIAVTVPSGTNVTVLAPTIVTTGVSVNPASSAIQDFTTPVIYTVTAEDNSNQAYTVTVTVVANAAIVLKPGWNIISVPNVVERHQFSAQENSTNFDIYILDPTKTSGWATMADFSQTEFTPLYGYFINNKTGAEQTLSLFYRNDLSPNEKLFHRNFFVPGWYSIGVANPTFVKPQYSSTVDTDNVSSILSDFAGYYSLLIDFTAGDFSTYPASIALSSQWQSVVYPSINNLNDLRETKGYAIFINKPDAIYSGFQGEIIVSHGTMTVSKADTVAAQNIAINLSNQPLGGFEVEVMGEPISVSQMVFRLSQWAGTGATNYTQDIINIALFDPNGTVVAGPVDIAASSPTVTFTDTITFPIGKKTYILKGKLTIDLANNDTIAASTTPASDWTTVTGQITGETITPSGGTITANTMTVKTASAAISVSPDPVAQTVVAGTQGFTFAKYIFDTAASGEDIRFSSIPLKFTNGGIATYITGCQLYDGSSALNTGSNAVNPTATGNVTLTFDSGFVVPKGTVKTITLKCNIAGSATSSSYYQWGMSAASNFNGTGITSGQSATLSGSANDGQKMTIASSGTLTVVLDSSSPSYAIANAGSTGVPLAVLKFHATTEAISLQKVSLKLTNTASSSATDLTQVTLWDGSTQVGTAVFTTTNYATSTLSTSVIIPKDGDKMIVVKGDLAAIGISQPGTQGHLVAVDYNGTDLLGTRGIGQNSGTTISSISGTDTTSKGVRVFKSQPIFAKLSVPSTSLVAGAMDLYRFSIKADPATGNGIGIARFTVYVATSSGYTAAGTTTVKVLKIYAYTDSGFSTPVSGGFTSGLVATTTSATGDGLLSGGNNVATTTNALGVATILQIPAGTTYYFRVVGTVAFEPGTVVCGGSCSVSTRIVGDTTYPSLAALMGRPATVVGNLIWSPNATTTSAITNVDWTNGYYVSGLPSTGMDLQTLSK